MHVYITWKEDDMKQLTPQVDQEKKYSRQRNLDLLFSRESDYGSAKQVVLIGCRQQTLVSLVTLLVEQLNKVPSVEQQMEIPPQDTTITACNKHMYQLILSIIYVIWVFIKRVYVIRILWIISKYLGAF